MVGAVAEATRDLEDYAYLLERAVLLATDLGLDTCWLGGITKNSFARKLTIRKGESIPAATTMGYGAAAEKAGQAPLRKRVGATSRLPWTGLFFDREFGAPLTPQQAGDYAPLLEMVRLGLSAKNKQPWRVIRSGATWQFYLRRTPGYREAFVNRLAQADDLQRLDMGIAMCHFELTAIEAGLKGHWTVADPGLATDDLTAYTVSWISEAGLTADAVRPGQR